MRAVRTRLRLRLTALIAVAAVAVTLGAQPASAVTPGHGTGVKPPVMHGYASGPRQRNGSAAHRGHYVPASATRARVAVGHVSGHRAPRADLAPPPIGVRHRVRTGSTRRAPGFEVVGHRIVTATRPGHGAGSGPVRTPDTSADNASYSPAATYDTVPMADQTGRISVTLTNSGTTTWSSSYGLAALVFPSSDTTGTGTPLSTGPVVPVSGTVTPNGSTAIESVTPAENPGSYTICWDMVNGAGAYFSAEGGSEYCAGYTIQQYSPVITEQEPLAGTDVTSQTPVLSATATVPGGYPAKPSFSFAFQILSSPSNTSYPVASSGWVADNGNSWSPATNLTWGTTYYWSVTVSDAASPPSLGQNTSWTTPISFVVGNAQPQVAFSLGNGYQADDGDPVMTSDLGGTDYDGSGKTVDPKTGNIAQQATDASVATAGPALKITRTYNSLDPRTSQAFGAGWSSLLDMSLVPDPDGTGSLILTLADGQQVRFAKTATGGYAPPQDLYAVVTALSGGGFSVTDQTGTTYGFAQASGTSWLISKITDSVGRTETFSYASGQLVTITSNTSGRALHLAWTTPSGASYPHVATVSTDPVTPGQPGTALTWTYGYSGDLLTSVCPPGTTTACTKYGYATNGSHAQSSVLNADPTSYYRLDDPAGSATAANQIPVNDLTTLDPPATEMATTPGVPGPVPGVTATGFNGTSSWIPLDGLWCTSASGSSCSPVSGSGRFPLTGSAASVGISLWFKTTATSGVLMGLSGTWPGCKSNCSLSPPIPLLWIAANGHLDGYGESNVSPLTSPSAVNNGGWHQAVLIPGQALYVDGVKVATSSWPFTPPSGFAVTLGTGFLPSGPYNPGPLTYFSGSLADLSLYQNQLPTVGTVAAQYAAETHSAAELTSITSPAGRSEFAATYDTVDDRVATVTDADGGTWTYGTPVRGSSSGAYDAAVMGSLPEDFWPLNDTAGPTARDLVGAANAADPRPVASYSNVTLGTAGPVAYTDGTAASFNGSSSQVSIPGGYFSSVGAESVELWFKTTGSGTLLSSGTSSTGGEPIDVWVNSSGCIQATVGNVSLPIIPGICTTANMVNDGKWHQMVLTLTAPVQTGSLAPVQNAVLYLDNKALYTSESATIPAASATGYTAYLGNGPNGYYSGALADVSFYTTALSATDVGSHYSALQNAIAAANPAKLPPGVTAPALNIQTIKVTDPPGKNAVYTYAPSGGLIETTSVLGGVTYYGYDSANRASTITDPDGDTTYMTYDAHNNVTSTTSCVAVNDCQTSYTSYYENLSNPLDPRNDKPTDARDPRSTSPSDPTYDTVTSYTTAGLVASHTTPATAACPAGCKTAYTYTAGTEPAVGGGTEPAGLVASVTSPGGGATSYAYDSAGDVMQTTSPLGLVTRYAYDNLGRDLSETEISDSYPAGLTTSYTYDSQGRVLTRTDPPVTNRVTGAVHTEVTTYTYDADSNVLTMTLSDSTGGDTPRTTTYTYNSDDELASVQDAMGNVTSYTYDGLGDRLTETNPAGVTTAYTYDAAGDLLTTTLDGYTGNPGNPQPPANLTQESRAYDPAGRLASVTNVKGTTTAYTYYGNNQLASSYIVPSGGGEQDVTSYGYDAAGDMTSQIQPSGLVTSTVYNPGNQVVTQTQDPAGSDRVTTDSYDPDGNVTSQSVSQGGVTQTQTMTYNAMDQQMSQTIDNTGGNLTSSVTRDQRGLVISQTDPMGNTTYIQNDEAGRPVVETDPAVATQDGTGGAPVTANPVTMLGYDTFGDQVQTSDPDGNIVTAAFDQDGQETSVTNPSYTPPGSGSPVNGTTTNVYNSLGEETSTTDPLGNTTGYGYDQLGDMTSRTDPGGATWTYTYDPAGEQLSVTDPTGAQTQATYDNLGQMITSTDLVRQNQSAAYTTSYGYDAAGDLTSQQSPTGVTTSAAFNPLGEKTSSTDGAGNTTTYTYNVDGEVTRTTLPDGTSTLAAYDLAGRQTSLADQNASGTVLRTASAGYDADGDVTSSTDFMNNTSTTAYNAVGEVTSQTQPVSSGQNITVSYGYDLAGNQTELTDGNGNPTYTTYNSLGLPQVVTEPSTSAYNTTSTRTTTDGYDADGELTSQTMPGGVTISDTYDSRGDLTGQSGSGASAPTATRTFTYDTVGRMLTASTGAAGTAGTFGYQPASSESFGYDDRGLLLSASGSAGATTYTYNGSGQPTSVTDAAGTSAYTYDGAGLLATDADAASGVTGTYAYNSLDQVTQIGYGSGKDTQSFGYDSLHRLTSDTIDTSTGAQVASIGYGYNNDDDVTSMTTSGLATAGGGTGTVTNTYSYDEANRLTSWTATPAGGSAITKTYGYDNDGNMTNDNGVTYSYDARDELVSDSNGNTYTYSADGDLTSQAGPGGAATFSTDAYGQQITDGVSSYTYDALDRPVTVGSENNSSFSIALTYDGDTGEVASDSSATYSRDPSGQITGVHTASSGGTLALDDGHDDLSGVFTAGGTAMTGSTTYNPWGSVIATTGLAIQVGYQGQWTDPATAQVSMGARFYRPGTGGFIDADTKPSRGAAAVTGNLFAYADDNPMTLTDLSGHSPSASSGAAAVSAADVTAAGARALEAHAKAATAKAEAAAAEAIEATADAAAHSAAALARTLNAAAAKLAAEAARSSAEAAAAFQAAQAELRVAMSWQDKATAAWKAAGEDAYKALHPGWEVWNAAIDFKNSLVEAAEATYDEARAGEAFAEFAVLAAKALGLQALAMTERGLAALATAAARGAGLAAELASRVADAAARQAELLTEIAAQDEAIADHDDAIFAELGRAYAEALAHKVVLAAKVALKTVAKAAKVVAKTVAKAAVVVAKTAYKASGAQAVVSCVTDPKLSSCVQAAITVATVVGTGGEGAIAEVAIDAAEDVATDAASDAATDVAADAATDDAADACTVGGQSFTASTKVLLADGRAVPISSLRPGEKVLATNTKTGKTQAETITAVLVHHDTDRYNLSVRTRGRTAVIDTTRNHLFWDPSLNKFLSASNLKPGTHLKTPDGQAAIVVSSSAPAVQDGWMWDLTVPGNNDHDFYVAVAATAVLVHNCSEGEEIANNIADHANERAQAGDGTHYVSGVGPQNLPGYVHQVLDGEVPGVETRYLSNGRIAHWDPATRAVVIEDGGGGTVFTPAEGHDYFEGLG